MKCPQCETPLANNAHFCPNCGANIAKLLNNDDDKTQRPFVTPGQPSSYPIGSIEIQRQSTPRANENIVDLPTKALSPQGPQAQAPSMPQESYRPAQTAEILSPHDVQRPIYTFDNTAAQRMMSPNDPPQPLQYYQQQQSKIDKKRAKMVKKAEKTRKKAPRNRLGCLVNILLFFVLILFVAGVAWVFWLRPYVHNMVYRELDSALTQAVDQIQLPPEAADAPPGIEVPITETGLTNTLSINLAPSNPVQKPAARITPQNIRISFLVYGYENAISLVPYIDSGRLAVKDVGVEGLASLVMSPDELTDLLNKHLARAQSKLPRAISQVTLQQRQMILTIG